MCGGGGEGEQAPGVQALGAGVDVVEEAVVADMVAGEDSAGAVGEATVLGAPFCEHVEVRCRH